MKTLLRIIRTGRYPVRYVFKRLLPIALSVLLSHSAFSQTSDTLWFENWDGDWTANWHVDNSGTWEVGEPTSGPGSAHSPGQCAATVLAGKYQANVATSIIRQSTFQVPPASENPRLRFWHWFDNANDLGYVRARVDGGAPEILAGPVTNIGGVWTQASIDLSAYENSTLELEFYFSSNGDGSLGNGWYIDDVALLTGPLKFNDIEDWEAGLEDWYVENGGWEVGIPGIGPGSAFSGQNCAALLLNDYYPKLISTRLVSPMFQMPTDNPRLRFWHWYNNGNDGGVVQIRINGGEWESISPTYQGNGGGVWTSPSLDLSAYAGSEVQIGFQFSSNGDGDNGYGWYIDDVAIITGAPQFNNPETWESGIGDWYVENGGWEVGIPGSGPGSAFNGQNCAALPLDGFYPKQISTRLVSPMFKVPANNPQLNFWHWYSNANDGGVVQIRMNGGEWETISETYQGSSSGGWESPSLDLSAYAGSEVQIGFQFSSNGDGERSYGWFIDDVAVSGDDPVGIEEAGDGSLITAYKLFPNHPNPFNPSTRISYQLPQSAPVKLTIYSLLGQVIQKLVDEHQPAGEYTLQWDGRDQSGKAVSSGVYLYRIEAGRFTDTKKMLLIR